MFRSKNLWMGKLVLIFFVVLFTCALVLPLTCFSYAPMKSQLLDLNSWVAVQNVQHHSFTSKDQLYYVEYPSITSGTLLTIRLQSVSLIDRVDFNVSNVHAANYTIRTAESPSDAKSLLGQTYAMVFKLSQTCYLYNVSLYLIGGKLAKKVDFAIFNASWNSTGARIEPDQNITGWNEEINVIFEDGWKTLDIVSLLGGPVALNVSHMDNASFFLALKQKATYKEFFWMYHEDTEGGDYGPAYNLTSTTPMIWEPLSIDFSMRVYVSVSSDGIPEHPRPSQIGLQVISGNDVFSVEDTGENSGFCSISSLGSTDALVFSFSSTWFEPVTFSLTVSVQGTSLLMNLLMGRFTQIYSLTTLVQNQERFRNFLIIGVIGAVSAAAASGYTVHRRRRVPLNALGNLESIIVDHNPSGTMLWSFDFISMQQDMTLVSGFMSAIKTFLEEMKVGGLKRLGTDFGTFIREETKLLTATCITGAIGLDEEVWIRGKLHDFLVKIEQEYGKQLETWKGEVSRFAEAFPIILASIIDLDKVHKLQMQKMMKLSKDRQKLQEKVNKYGEKLEKLKSQYDSGEIDFKKYLYERYKTEEVYDKVQKDYLYTSLFLQRTPSQLAKETKPKIAKEMEKLQNRTLEIKAKIDELEKKEMQGTITSTDIEQKQKLQRELLKLIQELDKIKEK